MKKTQRKNPRVVGVAGVPTEKHALVKTAEALVELNARDKEIQGLLGELNAKSSKLAIEQNALQRRRVELQRQFDAAAKD